MAAGRAAAGAGFPGGVCAVPRGPKLGGGPAGAGRLLSAPPGPVGPAGGWKLERQRLRGGEQLSARSSAVELCLRSLRAEFPGRKQTVKVLAFLKKEPDRGAVYALVWFQQKCHKVRGKTCSCRSEGLV